MDGFDTYTLLVAEIGEEAAKKVFKVFSGSKVPFPHKVPIFFRDMEICQKFRDGASYDDLSRAYSLSPRQIRNITSRTSQSKREEILQYFEIVD